MLVTTRQAFPDASRECFPKVTVWRQCCPGGASNAPHRGRRGPLRQLGFLALLSRAVGLAGFGGSRHPWRQADMTFGRNLGTESTSSRSLRAISTVALAVAVLAAGCANSREAGRDRPTAVSRWVRSELYFGAIPGEAWARFLAEIVTPRFPSGLTVFDAQGQWRARDGAVRQVPTRVLVILHPRTAAADESLEAIRREFKSRFGHESVLRADTAAAVSF